MTVKNRISLCAVLVCALMFSSAMPCRAADIAGSAGIVPSPHLEAWTMWLIALPITWAGGAVCEYIGVCTSEDSRAAVDFVCGKLMKSFEDYPSHMLGIPIAP